MDIKKNYQILKDNIHHYNPIWKISVVAFLIGLILLVIGFIGGGFMGDILISIGIPIMIGSLLSSFSATLLNFALVWAIPLLLNLFTSIYINYYLAGTVGALVASFLAPLYAGVTGWLFFQQRVEIDEKMGIERLEVKVKTE